MPDNAQAGCGKYERSCKVIKKERWERCTTHSKKVGASVYGAWGDSGTVGYRGDDLRGTSSFAELSMGSALGGLPYKARRWFIYKGRAVKAYKRDIGGGGGPVGGLTRSVDLWHQTSKRLGMGYGLYVVRMSKARCR